MLCAGCVHSPAILMRSGIGPADELRALGIDVLIDAPVGQNLVEHPMASLVLHLRPEARATSIESRHVHCCVRYSSGLAEAGANDMIIIPLNLASSDEAGLETGTIAVSAYRSFSRGCLRLVSRDPEVHPDIDLALLSDERDLVRMRDGARRLFTLAEHPAIVAVAERADLSQEAGGWWELGLWQSGRRPATRLIDDVADDDDRARSVARRHRGRVGARCRHVPDGGDRRFALGRRPRVHRYRRRGPPGRRRIDHA